MSHSAEQILKEKQLRQTPVRVKMLSVLVDRITLYRTLKAFEEKGIIHKIEDGSGISKFALCIDDCNEDHHHDEHVHFHCNDCGDTFCVEEVEVPYVQAPKKHKVKTMSIILNGTCENCQ